MIVTGQAKKINAANFLVDLNMENTKHLADDNKIFLTGVWSASLHNVQLEEWAKGNDNKSPTSTPTGVLQAGKELIKHPFFSKI